MLDEALYIENASSYEKTAVFIHQVGRSQSVLWLDLKQGGV